MAQHRYRVLRRLLGDKTYEVGDERIAAPGEVAHLVPHALADLGPVSSEKAEPELKNKAEPAPVNKAKPKGKAASKEQR